MVGVAAGGSVGTGFRATTLGGRCERLGFGTAGAVGIVLALRRGTVRAGGAEPSAAEGLAFAVDAVTDGGKDAVTDGGEDAVTDGGEDAVTDGGAVFATGARDLPAPFEGAATARAGLTGALLIVYRRRALGSVAR